MSHAHADQMTAQEVLDLARPILAERWGKFGFLDATVQEEEDFDGAYIFRMTAQVSEQVPTDELVDALDAILSALRQHGEGRFVYLSTQRPGEIEQDEDVE